jgi:hypothetical protein
MVGTLLTAIQYIKKLWKKYGRTQLSDNSDSDVLAASRDQGRLLLRKAKTGVRLRATPNEVGDRASG